MKAYASDSISPVRQVDRIIPIENELTQLNQYMDIRNQKASDSNEYKDVKKQTVSELSMNDKAKHPVKAIETVTISLEKYEQLRKDSERLKILEAYLINKTG